MMGHIIVIVILIISLIISLCAPTNQGQYDGEQGGDGKRNTSVGLDHLQQLHQENKYLVLRIPHQNRYGNGLEKKGQIENHFIWEVFFSPWQKRFTVATCTQIFNRNKYKYLNHIYKKYRLSRARHLTKTLMAIIATK